jgi:hypothetical protein
MTLQEFQTNLHSIYQGDTNTPSSTSGEWTYRGNLLNEAISIWENEKGMFWDELWTTLADASDGDTTIVAATLSYDMPSDYRYLGSYVKVGDSFYQIIRPSDKDGYTTESVCYVTGNKSSGYKLNFVYQPEVGETIDYPYYKEASEPSNTTDVIEMDDPYFCINWALYRMRSNDGEGQLSSAEYAQAVGRLKAMRTKNMLLPSNQPNSPNDTFSYGFGSQE